MDDLKAAKERVLAMKREIEAHQKAVIANLGPKAKLDPTPMCAACGGYVQKPALHLSKKYEELLFDTPICIYCLSHALDREVEDLKAEYKSDS